MKSIIEEASSIIKAIEKAWNQADNPKEFSIKIFEKEEKNFFGMTTKPAKIGIFFTDKPATHDKPTAKPRPEIRECRDEVIKHPAPKHQHPHQASKSHSEIKGRDELKHPMPKPHHPRGEQAHTAKKPLHPRAHMTPASHNADEQPPVDLLHTEKVRRIPATWDTTMIHAAETWLKQTLSLMAMNNINFTTEIAGKNLKLTFNTPLIADVMHEKQLFRSFAHLIMSSLRNQYKQKIKDLKVILIRPE